MDLTEARLARLGPLRCLGFFWRSHGKPLVNHVKVHLFLPLLELCPWSNRSPHACSPGLRSCEDIRHLCVSNLALGPLKGFTKKTLYHRSGLPPKKTGYSKSLTQHITAFAPCYQQIRKTPHAPQQTCTVQDRLHAYLEHQVCAQPLEERRLAFCWVGVRVKTRRFPCFCVAGFKFVIFCGCVSTLPASQQLPHRSVRSGRCKFLPTGL